ncbi:MAG TPA: carboxypeptidase-like regulatory domain-containing protein [Planctomycetota bacterium]
MPARRGRLLLSLLLLPAALLLWLQTSRTADDPRAGPPEIEPPPPAAPSPALAFDSQREVAASVPDPPTTPPTIHSADQAPQTPAPSTPWFGRVLDWSTGAPLSGAELRAADTQLALSAADGFLELDLSTARPSAARLELAGFSPLDLVLTSGHSTPATALRLGLVRTASLHVTVLGSADAAKLTLSGTLPLQGSGLSVFDTGDSFERAATTELDGTWTFQDLPPEVELVLDVRAVEAERRLLLSLAPGERRELVLDLDDACALRGEALDPSGAPLAQLEIWCLPAELSSGRFGRMQARDAIARATTDERGRFVLAAIPPGDWWIGPEPELRTAGSLVPCLRVVIAPGERERLVTLTCWPGLPIRGRVLDPDGGSAQALVVASCAGVSESTFSDKEGFDLGPLAPGEWTLTASLTLGAWAPGPPVVAQAGDQDVVLHLVAGARLAGTVLGRGKEADLAVSLLRLGPAEDFLQTRGADDGFEFGGLAPGTYALLAESGQRVALGGPYVLRAGETRSGLVLELLEGGELCVSGAPASPRTMLRFGFLGEELWFAGESGLRCRPLPAGPVRVQLVRWGVPVTVLAEAEAHLTPGTETWLDLFPR